MPCACWEKWLLFYCREFGASTTVIAVCRCVWGLKSLGGGGGWGNYLERVWEGPQQGEWYCWASHPHHPRKVGEQGPGQEARLRGEREGEGGSDRIMDTCNRNRRNGALLLRNGALWKRLKEPSRYWKASGSWVFEIHHTNFNYTIFLHGKIKFNMKKCITTVLRLHK